jgi:hypothetical protein
MKSITKLLALASIVAVMSLGAGKAMAQGRGNFDPAQFKQMRLDRLKEQMAVTDDAEWKVIEAAAGKVMDAQMDAMSGRFGGMTRNRGGNGGNNTDTSNNNNNNTRRGRFGGNPSAEMEALQKAIDDNASADVINAKLKAVRDANKAKEDKLEQAQADLRKLLTPRQEGIAVLNGILK